MIQKAVEGNADQPSRRMDVGRDASHIPADSVASAAEGCRPKLLEA